MLPWSVRATALIPCFWTCLTRFFTFTAPSSIEYCEWTWRWTKSAIFTGGRSRRRDARKERPGPIHAAPRQRLIALATHEGFVGKRRDLLCYLSNLGLRRKSSRP